jgi:hypothetical protein
MDAPTSKEISSIVGPRPFAARLKASNGAAKNNEIAGTRGVAVAVAKDMLKLSVLL